MSLDDLLLEGARELGIELNRNKLILFLNYLSNLKTWNQKINLTSINDDKEIIIKHFLDSLSTASFIKEKSKVLDIGSGAGFPGIPLKVNDPSLEVTLLDSVEKKVLFMRDTVRKLKLSDIDAVWGRAEDYGNGVPRSYFNFVVSRAVGEISDLVECSFPYLREEGKIILMRGRKGLEEWEVIREYFRERIELLETKQLKLPYDGQERVILSVLFKG